MSADNDKNEFALVPKTPTALERADPGAKRILTGMVADTLALVKNEKATETVISVAMCGWADPSFQEMVEMMLRHWLTSPYRAQFEFSYWTNDFIEAARRLGFDLFILWLNPGCYTRKGTAEHPPGREMNWDDHGDEIDAYDFIAALKREFNRPVIAVSNGFKYKSKSELEKAGADAVFSMPFGLDEFRSALYGCLKLSPFGIEKKNLTAEATKTEAIVSAAQVEDWYRTGKKYYFGEGVAKDLPEAMKWFRKAAEQNHAQAELCLGNCLCASEGVDENWEEALKWYRKAAEKNLAGAEFRLGYCYREGKGVPKDYAEAAKWFRRAADHGSGRQAEYNLGSLYESGKGLAKDYVEAVKWYQRAANAYHADAQHDLGRCYENGRGVPQDFPCAYSLYKLAAGGDWPFDERKTFRQSLERIAERMTAIELENGERLYREYLRSHPDFRLADF